MNLPSAIALLATDEPQGLLYHYTSLGALLKIANAEDGGFLYATEAWYMNDGSEARHAFDLVEAVRKERRPNLPLTPGMRADIQDSLVGVGLYLACLTTQGNQLSQWRGYTPQYKGVSIGFSANDLVREATQQEFKLRQCVYDSAQQRQVAERLWDILQSADSPDAAARQATEEEALEEVQTCATVLKHPKFEEEREWRLVSKVPPLSRNMWGDNWVPVPRPNEQYREGHSMLIPYRRFTLPRNEAGGIKIEQVIIGPTLHPGPSVASVENFLISQRCPNARVEYCDIPLRQA